MMGTDETGVVSVEEENDSEKKEFFDHDGFWKDLIDRFFYFLLKRAAPELYEKVDLTKEKRFLDKEFRDILNTGDPQLHTSPHFADYVIEVPTQDGDLEWVLFHIEIQGAGGGNLAERMYHYKCLIYAHFRKNPVALALIIDGHRKEERFYSHSRFGTENMYRYKNLVLADLRDEELLSSDNPIDLVLYAAKCSLSAKGELQKYHYLRTLLKLLSERGWGQEDKRDLLLFLERIMNLKDKELEKQYTEYRSQLREEGKIVYIPLGERELAREIEQRGRVLGMKEGMEQGRIEGMEKGMERGRVEGMEKGMEKGRMEGMEKGKEEMARKLLASGISPDLIAQSADLPLERIRSLTH